MRMAAPRSSGHGWSIPRLRRPRDISCTRSCPVSGRRKLRSPCRQETSTTAGWPRSFALRSRSGRSGCTGAATRIAGTRRGSSPSRGWKRDDDLETVKCHSSLPWAVTERRLLAILALLLALIGGTLVIVGAFDFTSIGNPSLEFLARRAFEAALGIAAILGGVSIFRGRMAVGGLG